MPAALRVYVIDSQKPKGFEIVPAMSRAFSFTIEGDRAHLLEYVGALSADDAEALGEALLLSAKLMRVELDIEFDKGAEPEG